MDRLVARLDRREDFVPFALNNRSVGMQLVLKSRPLDDFFAFDNVLGKGNAYSDRDHTEIDHDLHSMSPFFTAAQPNAPRFVAGPRHPQYTTCLPSGRE